MSSVLQVDTDRNLVASGRDSIFEITKKKTYYKGQMKSE